MARQVRLSVDIRFLKIIIFWHFVLLKCSKSLPKEFEKTTEVLPFTKHGLSSIEEFKKAQEDVQYLECLKKADLTDIELKLYQNYTEGKFEQYKNVESNVLVNRLETIHQKIEKLVDASECSKQNDQPSTSNAHKIDRVQTKATVFYPNEHPMNEIKQLEESLFGHLKSDIIPITKRRKLLRRLERKKKRILAEEKQFIAPHPKSENRRPGSLWDVQELPVKLNKASSQSLQRNKLIGPKNKTLYTIKNGKIVRLEPVERKGDNKMDEYRAMDIVMPVNAAEAQLLEGTKMSIDDIKKIDRFKDYEPGVPSKVLYLKNIAPSVSQEQVSLLFNQFVLANGGPIDVRLMTGRMRGQAFVAFQNEDLAIQALEETNGTIMSGRPIIAVFGNR